MKEMTHMRKRLLDDFIIPALNSNKYPGKLYWFDRDKGIFRIYWSHKNAAKWESEDTIVFQDWDRLKNRFKPESKNYFMSAKQRFRAALYKLSNHVIPLKSIEKTFRDYQLKSNAESKKQSDNLPKSKAKMTKKTNQCLTRPSVIHKNTSYVAKSASEAQKQKSPSPDYEYTNVTTLCANYSNSWSKINQLKTRRLYESTSPEITQKNTREVHETSVLRENSSTPRISHISSQPVPVYSPYKQYPRFLTIYEGPEVFVSPIYNGPENVPQSKDDTQSSVYATDEDASGILNLSLKSDGSDTLSRSG